MIKVFDSRDSRYRRPFGALPRGTALEVTIRPPAHWTVTRAVLVASVEGVGESREVVLTRGSENGGHDVFYGRLPTDGILGLVWYHFRLERGRQSPLYYGNKADGLGGEGQLGGSLHNYQLTVYDGAFTVPAWYGESVTYHIFPDRFAKEGPTPGLSTLIGRRSLHLDWNDTPDYLPNLQGEITCSDFFGGNIAGIRSKLDYLAGLGVGTIYLSPIFEAASNHRYDTADYHAIDPLFGDEEQFRLLCDEAGKRGMRILLDGVFNHTGFDSRYFNGRGSYPEPGASQSKESPYYEWYDFSHWPHEYSSWWGIYTLPQVREDCESYNAFLLNENDGVVRKWLRLGASGWRLDVVDELPDAFVRRMRAAVKAEKQDAVLIGEVWEDASYKIAYGVRRRYFWGDELDGVMNYPLRDALLGYLLGGRAHDFMRAMECLREHYPRPVFYSLMNFLGSHDTPRVLTVLGAEPADYAKSKSERAYLRLPPERYALAVARLKMGALILYSFPGSPCVFYGDEAGLEGFEDPLNRRTYPWGRENTELLAWYRKLGAIRGQSAALRWGGIEYHQADDHILCFARVYEDEALTIAANNDAEPRALAIHWDGASAEDLMTGRGYAANNGRLIIELPAYTAVLLKA